MTREQAISKVKGYLTDYLSSNDYKEIEEIINAIGQEPCEDVISRKALIERINHAEDYFKSDHMESIGSNDGDPFVDGVLSAVFNIREMVMQAPSVTPQDKS